MLLDAWAMDLLPHGLPALQVLEVDLSRLPGPWDYEDSRGRRAGRCASSTMTTTSCVPTSLIWAASLPASTKFPRRALVFSHSIH